MGISRIGWISSCNKSNRLHPHSNKNTITQQIKVCQQKGVSFHQCTNHLRCTFGPAGARGPGGLHDSLSQLEDPTEADL